MHGEPSGKIEVYNLRKNYWEKIQLEGDLPVARHKHSACLFDSNKILIFGGEKTDAINRSAIITIQETNRNKFIKKNFTHFLLKAVTIEYRIINTSGGIDLHRFDHSANIYLNKMYVFGGRIPDSTKCTNQLWGLDLGKMDWIEWIFHWHRKFHMGAISYNRRSAR